MADKRATWFRAHWTCLILKTLELEAIARLRNAVRIEQISKGVFQVNPGSAVSGIPQAGAGRLAQEANGVTQRITGARNIIC